LTAAEAQVPLAAEELEVFSEMELASHLTNVNPKEVQLLDLVLQDLGFAVSS
jgi:hypothetical protein